MMNATRPTNGRQWKERMLRSSFPNNCFSILHRLDLKNRLRKGPLVYAISILMLLASLGLPAFAAAENVTLIPRLAVGGGYDDNLLFTEDEKIDSWVASVKPGLAIDYRTPLTTFVLSADFDILRYLDESDLDTVNQYYQLTAEHQMKSRWTTAADLAYTKDTTFDSFLEETGRVIELGDRDYFKGQGSVSYDVSEISTIYTSYQYTSSEYEDESYTDYDLHRGDLLYQHRLGNEQDTLAIGPSLYHRRNDLNTVDSASLDLGLEAGLERKAQHLCPYRGTADNGGAGGRHRGGQLGRSGAVRFDLEGAGVNPGVFLLP